MELFLLLFELHGFCHPALTLNHVEFFLHRLAFCFPLLPAPFHLFNFVDALHLAALFGASGELTDVGAAGNLLFDLLAPNEALREVGVAKGIVGVGVARGAEAVLLKVLFNSFGLHGRER
jgi:hypothetical protein